MDSVFGGQDVQAAIEAPAAAPAPDPAKVEAVGAAARDLAAHASARAAQLPDLAEHFRDVVNVSTDLAKRFERTPQGQATVLGHVTDTEARLVEGLVAKLVRGRSHKELDYLAELAENLTIAVASAAIV